MKALQIILLITGVALFLALAGCGGSGNDDGPEPPVDTVAVEPPPGQPLPPYLPDNWAKLYPMDSLSPLLPPWRGKWVCIKAINMIGMMFYENDRPLSELSYMEFYPDGRLIYSKSNGDFFMIEYYALDSLHLYRTSTDPNNVTPMNIFIDTYAFLTDSIIRLDYAYGYLEHVSTTLIIFFYQRLQD